ncbi:MAG: endonuclease III [Eubacteriales bacterium]|nr:endonuclease III [Eubacteriales bacterium]
MSKESLKSKRERATRIIQRLIEAQPDARCTLDYKEDWQLLFAAILAAQCTDERVNKVTAPMFERWPNLPDYAALSLEELEEAVKTCGLYRNKAKAISASSRSLLENYEGKVPAIFQDLISLPGVGQKIANLLLGELFGQAAMVVDTHNGRIARLLGFSEAKDPKGVEKDLVKIVPEEYWIVWGHHMVELGRTHCKARCRMCLSCPIAEDCAYADKQKEKLKELRQEGDLDACC